MRNLLFYLRYLKNYKMSKTKTNRQQQTTVFSLTVLHYIIYYKSINWLLVHMNKCGLFLHKCINKWLYQINTKMSNGFKLYYFLKSINQLFKDINQYILMNTF